jgi:hypothetical protein
MRGQQQNVVKGQCGRAELLVAHITIQVPGSGMRSS